MDVSLEFLGAVADVEFHCVEGWIVGEVGVAGGAFLGVSGGWQRLEEEKEGYGEGLGESLEGAQATLVVYWLGGCHVGCVACRVEGWLFCSEEGWEKRLL